MNTYVFIFVLYEFTIKLTFDKFCQYSALSEKAAYMANCYFAVCVCVSEGERDRERVRKQV